MIPITTREQLLNLAARNAPTNSCARKIREGRVRVWKVPNVAGWRGWVIATMPPNDHGHIIGIGCDEDRRRYVVAYLESFISTGLEEWK